MKKGLALFAILLLLSCNTTQKSRISSEKISQGTKVIKTYFSLAALDTVAIHTDVQLLDSALKVHNMSRDEFNRVIEYFKKNPGRFNEELTGINDFINQIKVE